MSEFKQRVLKIVKLIPEGRVANYGQVALYAGYPRAAREVGWTLNRLPEDTDVPWWRVINKMGKITIKGSIYSPRFQGTLLKAEGVSVTPDLTVDMSKYVWTISEDEIKELNLNPEYQEILKKRL